MKEKNIQIDIVMPCYYKSSIIQPALEQISKQTAKNQLKLIMINDASPFTDCNYNDLLQQYQNKIDILLINLDHNVGPGISRQVGLNYSNGDYVLFHDDDDILVDNYAIETLINAIPKNEKIKLIKGGIIGTESQFSILPGQKNNTLQATIFNNRLIKELNITFHPVSSFFEEDGVFQFEYFCNVFHLHNYKSIYIDNLIYQRKHNNNYISLSNTISFYKGILSSINMDYACLDIILHNPQLFDDWKNDMYFTIIRNLPIFFNLFLIRIEQENGFLSQKEYFQLKLKILRLIDFINNLYNPPNLSENMPELHKYEFLVKDYPELLNLTYQDFLNNYKQQLQKLYNTRVKIE